MNDQDFYRFCYSVIDSGGSLEEIFDLESGETIKLPPREELEVSTQSSGKPFNEFLRELIIDAYAVTGMDSNTALEDEYLANQAEVRALKRMREILRMSPEDIAQEHLVELAKQARLAEYLGDRRELIRDSELGQRARKANVERATKPRKPKGVLRLIHDSLQPSISKGERPPTARTIWDDLMRPDSESEYVRVDGEEFEIHADDEETLVEHSHSSRHPSKKIKFSTFQDHVTRVKKSLRQRKSE